MSMAVAEFYICELLCEGFIILGEVVDILLFLHLLGDFTIVSLIDTKLTKVFVQVAVLIQQMCLITVEVLLLSSIFHFCLCELMLLELNTFTKTRY